jgi:hypothetical protein
MTKEKGFNPPSSGQNFFKLFLTYQFYRSVFESQVKPGNRFLLRSGLDLYIRPIPSPFFFSQCDYCVSAQSRDASLTDRACSPQNIHARVNHHKTAKRKKCLLLSIFQTFDRPKPIVRFYNLGFCAQGPKGVDIEPWIWDGRGNGKIEKAQESTR